MISICMATYNGEKYIHQQLESIRMQTRPADEVIICDDCSTDRTVAVIRAYVHRFRLEESWKIYSNTENKGYPNNFYYAMSLCHGDIVFLADQDDIWKKNKIEKMAQVMARHEQIQLLASKWAIINSEGRKLKSGLDVHKKDSLSICKISVDDILHRYQWPGMALCYRKALAESLLCCSGHTKVAHDLALTLHAAQTDGFYAYSEICQYHRRHEGNVALEENRIAKLLKKSRKLMEIDRYLEQLNQIINSECISLDEKLQKLKKKQTIMNERKKNLQNGDRKAILKQYLHNRRLVRPATVICDLLICRQKY